MTTRTHDSGETLVEILLTIVIVGLTFAALLTSLATAGNAGNVQRSNVQADVVMRNYAEATKAGAQACSVAGTTYSVVYSPPAGFTVATSPTGNVCPSISTPRLLTLRVAGPKTSPFTMQIKVATS